MIRTRILLASLLLMLAASRLPAQDMPLSQVLIPGEGWHLASDGLEPAISLTADRDGTVLVSTGKRIVRLNADGKAETFVKTTRAGRITLGPDGRLYVVEPRDGRIIAVGVGGKQEVVGQGLRLQDIAVLPGGKIYYTSPENQTVHLLGRAEPVDRGIARPQGLTAWHNAGTLVVGDGEGKRLFVFRIDRDGTLDAKDGYATVRIRPKEASGTAQLTFDVADRLYAATTEGVQVFDPTGRMCGVLTRPQRAGVTGVCFGGPDRDRLYVVCGGKVYWRKTKTRGQPPVKGP